MFSLGSTSSILSLCSLTNTLVNNKSSVSFYVNNKKHTIENPLPHMYLSEYIRETLNLKGTKIGCQISECGACSVVVSRFDKKSNKPIYETLNSCAVPICSVDGCSILTVEALGDDKKLHPIQKELVEDHAIQCGFCTPGIEMTIYASLKEQMEEDLKEEKSLENKMKSISKNLTGNLCRCTGYRPIFQAVEKMVKNPGLYSADVFAFPSELKDFKPQEISVADKETGLKWMTPTTLDAYLNIKEKNKQINVIYGNSWLGPQCKERCDHRESCADCTKKWGTYVFARNINELKALERKAEENFIILGSQNTLTEISEFLKQEIKNSNNYESRGLKAAVEMIGMFGSRQKRNGCTLEEAIMDCHPQNDINTLLTGLGATIILMNTKKEIRKVAAGEFFATGGPKGKSQFRRVAKKSNEILFGIELPFTKQHEFVRVFKQSRRRENDQAIVNSVIRVNFAPKSEGEGFEVENAVLAYGGVAITTARAKKAEQFLKGRNDFDAQTTLNEVIRLLNEEFPMDEKKTFGGMAKYRAALMISAYFKFYLQMLDELYRGSLKQEEISAIKPISEKIPAKGFQTFEEPEPKLAPIGEAASLLSAKTHSTGESIYIDDMRRTVDELEAVMVLSKRPNAKIKKIDYSKALKMKGVFAWVDSKDIPQTGSNLFALVAKDEKVFYDDYAPSYGLCVGVILAENKRIAQIARDAVKIEYEDGKEQTLLTIQDALEKKSIVGEPHPVSVGNSAAMFKFMESEENKDKYIIMEGELNIGGQEHIYLETNGVRAVPSENNEMKVFAGTQNVSEVQRVVSDVLGIPRNRVVCHAKRVGGSFGAKEEKPSILAAIASVCAYKYKRPVRLVLDRYTDVTWSGQRHAYYAKYKVGCEKATGKIQAMNIDFFNNAGCTLDLSDGIMHKTVTHCTNSYHIPNVSLVGICCKTHTISNTAFRGFGAPQGMVTVDTIVDNLAYEMGMDPMELKQKNFYSTGDMMPCHQIITENPIPNLWEECKKVSSFETRRKTIQEFNKVNKWVKRGIYMNTVKYAPYFSETKFLNQASALVCIYRDGSVIVSHGGHEMGQGLYTKVAQVAAYELGCPLSSIYLEDTASDKTPNVPPTAASSGSDVNSAAVKNACDKLNARLAPIRAKLGPKASFKDIANNASLERISLSATGFYIVPSIWFDKEKGTGVFPYFTHGVGCSEVEVDTLTGDYKILRSDIVMDIGRSINPGLDVGQIEGGFMQAVGLFTQEELVKGDSAHPWLKPGKFWTNSPAKYKIPSCLDSPNVVNVHLLKNTRNSFAIHGSRAIGEPSLYLGSTVYFAIKEAVRAARKEQNPEEKNFRFDTPATCERIRMSCADSILKEHVLGEDLFKNYKVKGTY